MAEQGDFLNMQTAIMDGITLNLEAFVIAYVCIWAFLKFTYGLAVTLTWLIERKQND